MIYFYLIIGALEQYVLRRDRLKGFLLTDKLGPDSTNYACSIFNTVSENEGSNVGQTLALQRGIKKACKPMKHEHTHSIRQLSVSAFIGLTGAFRICMHCKTVEQDHTKQTYQEANKLAIKF